MSGPRETIATTLLALLSEATGVNVATRRFTAFDEVAPGDFPYLILMQDQEQVDTNIREAGATIALKKIAYKVLIYASGDGTENSIPATALNNMIDAIEAALTPVGFANLQQLGLPYVRWALLKGPIEYDGSAFGNVGVAVIPIEVAYS